MILLGLDLETTGIDKVADRPIEVGLTLWTTKYNRSLETHNFLVQSDGVAVTDEITAITGITQKMVDTQGYPVGVAYEMVMSFVNAAEGVVAFNGRRFDIPMMRQWAARQGTEFPQKFIIDPFDGDIPMRPQELITMCAKQGIYYDAHEAGADVTGMLKLLLKFPLDVVVERASSPSVIVQSGQKRSENSLAKQHKFRWNPDYKVWWKAVKQVDLRSLIEEIGGKFPTQVRPDLTKEELDTND
jgi:DNA polymerase III alpha subunit (gram-positive type)